MRHDWWKGWLFCLVFFRNNFSNNCAFADSSFLDNRPHWYSLQEDCPSRHGKRPRIRTMSSSDSCSSLTSHTSRRHDPEGGSSGTCGRRPDIYPTRTASDRSGAERSLETQPDLAPSPYRTPTGPRARGRSESDQSHGSGGVETPGKGDAAVSGVDGDGLHESVSQELLFHGVGLPSDVSSAPTSYKVLVNDPNLRPRISKGDVQV